LYGAIVERDFDIFSISAEGFYFDVIIGLKAKELLRNRDKGVTLEWHLDCALSHEAIYH
jgi:hypothetical protein